MTIEKGNGQKDDGSFKIMMVKVKEEEADGMALKKIKEEGEREISEISDFQEIQSLKFPSFDFKEKNDEHLILQNKYSKNFIIDGKIIEYVGEDMYNTQILINRGIPLHKKF